MDRFLSNGIPDNTAAVQLCLYEEADNTWSLQFTCSDCFDPEDDDWACYEVFTTGEDLFIWNSDENWEDAQHTAESLMKSYLEKGKFKDIIKSLHGVGVGFADGDLEIIYLNENSLAPIRDLKGFAD